MTTTSLHAVHCASQHPLTCAVCRPSVRPSARLPPYRLVLAKYAAQKHCIVPPSYTTVYRLYQLPDSRVQWWATNWNFTYKSSHINGNNAQESESITMKMLVYDSFSIFILHAFLYILFRPKTIDKFYCVFFAEQVLTFFNLGVNYCLPVLCWQYFSLFRLCSAWICNIKQSQADAY